MVGFISSNAPFDMSKLPNGIALYASRSIWNGQGSMGKSGGRRVKAFRL